MAGRVRVIKVENSNSPYIRLNTSRHLLRDNKDCFSGIWPETTGTYSFQGGGTNHRSMPHNQPARAEAPPPGFRLNTLRTTENASFYLTLQAFSTAPWWSSALWTLCVCVSFMHHHQSFGMFHQQEQKGSQVVLDVIPPHYNVHHGQPSPPQSPTQHYTKGESR